MRRTLLLVVVGVVVTTTAPPAGATKDPFRPVVTATSISTSTTTTTATVTETNQNGEPMGVVDATTESMPTTGADVASWLVVAYLLAVAGAAAVVLSRTLRPGA